jgi:serine/threonine protein kinase
MCLTASGTVAGTPAFLAPEQIEGKSSDHRADLFSLGSVLYFLASGRLPFPAENIATTLTQIVSSSPKPIGKLVPDLPEWLEELIISLHERNPVDRVQSAEEVVEIIAAFDSGRESRIVRAKKALRSGQALPTRVVGITLASVLVAVVAAFSLGGREPTTEFSEGSRLAPISPTVRYRF